MKSVLYFSASWCGPCKAFGPQFTQIMENQKDTPYMKIDIDTNNLLPARHNVRGIPTVIVLKDGEEVSRLTGAQVNKTALEKILAQ